METAGHQWKTASRPVRCRDKLFTSKKMNVDGYVVVFLLRRFTSLPGFCCLRFYLGQNYSSVQTFHLWQYKIRRQ